MNHHKRSREKGGRVNSAKQGRTPPVVLLLAVLFAGALIINIIMVTIAVRNRSDLVRKDYYDHALQQDMVNRDAARADSLGIRIELFNRKGVWKVALSSNDSLLLKGRSLRGSVYFYRPSNSDRDMVHPLEQIGDTTLLQTPEIMLESGFWQAQVHVIVGTWLLKKRFDLHVPGTGGTWYRGYQGQNGDRDKK